MKTMNSKGPVFTLPVRKTNVILKYFDAPTANSDLKTNRQDFLPVYNASNIHYIRYIC